MNEELKKRIIEFKEKRKKDGYKIENASSNKYTLEEAIVRMIKSHT
jgi:sulfatase maturation enzyme AslB (radical SAM superfamily)